jgi:CysZ protein
MVLFFQALILALRDLSRPAVLRLIVKSILLTLLILITLGGIVFWAARHFAGQSRIVDGLTLDMASVVLALLLIAGGWLLFRGVAIFVIGLFADSIVEDVERHHYPEKAASSVAIGFGRSLRLSIRSFARFLGVNLIALPFYIILIPTAIGAPILALIVNAWLLGKDLEAMVKLRHLGLAPLSTPMRWGLGLLSAASISIPIVNFLAPVLSASMAVHLFHIRSKDRS